MRNTFCKKAGFTLIEMMTAMMILAILLLITVVSYIGVTRSGNEAKIKADLASYSSALGEYAQTNGKYPATMEEVESSADLKLNDEYSYNYYYLASSNGFCMDVSYKSSTFYVSSSSALAVSGFCPKMSASSFLNVTYYNDDGCYPEMIGNDVAETSDGGYIVAGEIRGCSLGYALAVVKYDPNGGVEWARQGYDTSSDYCYGTSVIQDSEGNYVVSVVTNNEDDPSDVLLVKFDSTGQTIWSRSWGDASDERIEKIIEDNYGGYVLVGQTDGHGADGIDALMLKVDRSGNFDWATLWRGPNSSSREFATSVMINKDGDLVMSGSVQYGAGGDNYFIAVFGIVGYLRWDKVFSGNGNGYGHSVTQDASGDYILVGSWDFYDGNDDIVVVKSSSQGDLKWVKAWGESGTFIWDWADGVVVDSTGSYIVAGTSSSHGASFYSRDALLLEISPYGQLIRSVSYSDASGNEDEANAIAPTIDGGLIMTGMSKPDNSPQGIFVRKFDSSLKTGNCDINICKDVSSDLHAPTVAITSIDVNAVVIQPMIAQSTPTVTISPITFQNDIIAAPTY